MSSWFSYIYGAPPKKLEDILEELSFVFFHHLHAYNDEQPSLYGNFDNFKQANTSKIVDVLKYIIANYKNVSFIKIAEEILQYPSDAIVEAFSKSKWFDDSLQIAWDNGDHFLENSVLPYV